MNTRIPTKDLNAMKFGVGQSVPRNEDPILVTGQGKYSDDVSVAGQLYASFIRSPYAHGIIRSIDASAALEMSGVVAVYSAKDLEGHGYGTLPCLTDLVGKDGSKIIKPVKTIFATDKVRFTGDPIAMVVAKTAVLARDAAEAVIVDIEALPVVTTMDEAIKPGAPQLYDEAPGNVILDYQFGDSHEVEAAFKRAAHVTKVRIVNSRVIVNAMEPRSAIGEYDKRSGRYTLTTQCQGAFGMRGMIATQLNVGTDKVRILTGNVGGSFGMKISPFPEYLPLLHASRELGKPVKWTDLRSESYLSDHHGRDMVFDAELALDKRGMFLATRFTCLANMGGYVTTFGPMMPTANVPKNCIGMYQTPLVEVRTKCVMTNTVPIGAYRGAGRPESNYCMERLINAAAEEMGIDSIALRKRNLIKPSQIPYVTPAATTYDSGDFPALLEQTLKASDWKGFAARKRASKKAGLLRGIGMGCYLEVTGPPANEMGGIHFEDDGSVTIVTGTLDFGQGHWSAFAQVLTTKLGVPFEKIKLVQGDSDILVAGGGTGGSKSIMASGKAIIEASDIVIEKGKAMSAHIMEAAVEDIAFQSGRFSIAGTDKSIGIMELAAQLQGGLKLPKSMPQTLDVDHIIKPSLPAYPNGCHVCEVEIDPDTGVTRVVRYVMVNDFGTLINPMLVEGQMHGGVVQGIGQAIYEMTSFDETGQLLTGSFMDYCMPRADDVPFFTFESQGIPATTNPLGAKGCGEAGCAGAMPSVVNAIINALSGHGVTKIDMPATPEKVWRLINKFALKC